MYIMEFLVKVMSLESTPGYLPPVWPWADLLAEAQLQSEDAVYNSTGLTELTWGLKEAMYMKSPSKL